MPLRSGFNLHEYEENNSDKWKKKWEKLSDEDKGFYSNTLPFLLLCEDISHVSKETIPIILKRHEYNPIVTKDTDKYLTKDYLSKFIGFEANVETKSDKEFFAKLLRTFQMKEGGTLKDKKAINKEHINYAKEVYNKDISEWFK
jgi:hypothetical protein